ncbi:MAG: hypothetical protein WC087_02670 [Candidatus Paceibacterota bacterium]
MKNKKIKIEKVSRDSTSEKKKYFLEFLETSKGIISVVCNRLNIHRSTYYNWYKTDKDFKKRVDEINKSKIDILEDRMYLLALEGNYQALRYYIDRMDNKGKKKTSEVHIHHHRSEVGTTEDKKTFEDVVDDILDALDKEALDKGSL